MSSINESSTRSAQWPAYEPNPEIREMYVALEREYPAAAAEFTDGVSRRRWLQLMGASLALSGAVGCRYQTEHIAPLVFREQDRHPGDYVHYATCIELDGVAAPVLVTTIDGRPIKIDGNPQHPSSNGASDIFSQSRILDLYDPDRSQSPWRKVDDRKSDLDWESFASEVARLIRGAADSDSQSLAFLTPPDSSPTIARLRSQLMTKYPSVRWFEYSSLAQDNVRAGIQLAFGQAAQPHYDFAKARIILAIDADPMSYGGNSLAASRGIIAGRNPDSDWMSRIYSVETQFSLLGGSADHRLALAPSQIISFVAELEQAIENKRVPSEHEHFRDRFFAAVVEDLLQHRGESCLVCGEAQPPEVHAAVWRLNQLLGNIDSTVRFSQLEEREPSMAQLRRLVAAMNAGELTTLVMVGGNPVYDAPADFKFAEALAKIPTTVHLACTENETSRACGWFGNTSHPLEAWGDGRAYDGSYCVAQPMIAPLYQSRSFVEFLASCLQEPEADGLSIVRKTAQQELNVDERQWREAVHLGYFAGSSAERISVSNEPKTALSGGRSWKTPWEDGDLELVFVPSRQLLDGRFANVSWLVELPDFVTKMAWDNAAILSPLTARKLGVRQGQVVSMEVGGNQVDIPVHVQPGHANGTVTLTTGFGRWAVGRVGGDEVKGIPLVGVNVNPLRTSDAFFSRSNSQLTKTAGRRKLALTQDPFQMDKMGRAGIRRRLGDNSYLIRSGTHADYTKYVSQHGNKVDSKHLLTEHDPPDLGAVFHQNGHAGGNGHGHTQKRGVLPVINVSHKLSSDDTKAGADDTHHEDDHGGHADVRWPTGHGLHFENKSLSPGPLYSSVYKWGMSIDLSKCVGCNACVIACQSENNIPIVGRDEMLNGREMHWMRIDAYFVEDADDPDAEHASFKFQPVTCQHCENAPCETVCPVAATSHSDEGLNDMAYNRCIGTRYCGNNCPYKVRRFNYLNYSEAVTFLKYPGEGVYNEKEKQIRGLGANPEVSIRSRGVMEKCTYCVQRIQNTKIKAKNEGRLVGGNEITTACQDACPTSAIVFGNLADPSSQAHQNHLSVRAYQLLDQLNNQPRTRYLARVHNPHRLLAKATDNNASH